jgi:hypothetical protein
MAETCSHCLTNKYDPKTVVFRRTNPPSRTYYVFALLQCGKLIWKVIYRFGFFYALKSVVIKNFEVAVSVFISLFHMTPNILQRIN